MSEYPTPAKTGRLPGFTLPDSQNEPARDSLLAALGKPDNPEAYRIAFDLVWGRKKSSNRPLPGQDQLVDFVLSGNSEMVLDIIKYAKDLIEREHPEFGIAAVDQVGFWLLIAYQDHQKNWKPTYEELMDLSSEVWDGGLSVSTIKRHCKRLNLPVSGKPGRPKKN